MTYVDHINKLLLPQITEKAKVLDLFAGCGGLSLGFEAAGFETIGYECVQAAVDTYNKNLKGHCYCEFLTVGYNYPDIDNIDIVIGGPPCQPFSRIGSQRGMEDASFKSSNIDNISLAFLDQFRTISNNIAWETEVWIADIPEHMIHFNGWKFLEIHK